MSLEPGTRLGPYEITAAIGAGGMGEVYRAKDGRLGRDVAIKVLPASFANDADRRARFEREAQAVAALSHPNVVAIFDTGVHEGQLYVVMELLAGQTLRERLTTSSTASTASAAVSRRATWRLPSMHFLARTSARRPMRRCLRRRRHAAVVCVSSWPLSASRLPRAGTLLDTGAAPPNRRSAFISWHSAAEWSALPCSPTTARRSSTRRPGNGKPFEMFSTQESSPESRALGLADSQPLSISRNGEMLIRRQGTLARVPVSGGAPRDVAEGVSLADWAPDGVSFAVVHRGGVGEVVEFPVGKKIYETPGIIIAMRVASRGGLIAVADAPLSGDSTARIVVMDYDGRVKTTSALWTGIDGLGWSPAGSELWFLGDPTGSDFSMYAMDLTGRTRMLQALPYRWKLADVAGDGRVLLRSGASTAALWFRASGAATETNLYWHDHSSGRDIAPDLQHVLFSEGGAADNQPDSRTYVRGTDGSPAVEIGEGLAMAFSPDSQWAITSLNAQPSQLVAYAVAALSHPNVIAIFDTGVHEGQFYLVMELLAGQTLRERLTTSSTVSTASAAPIPVRKAVDIAVQIARGLGSAHGKAIVHRDLKPENIFLLDDGQVKILDFGLARQATSAERSGATQTMAATDPGTVMGTVGYMAPEQVRGQTVDARADLFAFGAVLYEMVSGQRAFQRDTPADTMSAILNADPPELATGRTDIAPGLDRIIRHCLEKNVAERFQTARDIAFALDAFSGTSVSSSANAALPAAQTPPRRRWLRAALVSGAIALVAAGMLIARALAPASSSPKFEMKTWDAEWITNARFGPDGQTMVFSSARAGNVPRLYVIRSGGVLSQPIGDPGTHLLAVSSTGELAVVTGARLLHHRLFAGTLSRMALDGAPRPLMTDVIEADWSPDGSKLAVIRTTPGGVRIEYPPGQVRYEKKGGYLSDLHVSSDDTQIAFFEHDFGTDDRGVVSVVDLRSGAVRKLTSEFWGLEGLAWSADGKDVLFSASSGQGARCTS